jgi:hypothetical protein
MDTSTTVISTMELEAVPGNAGAASALCGFCNTVLPPKHKKWCSKKCYRLFTRKYDARNAVCDICQKPVAEKGRFKYCSEPCKKQGKVNANRAARQENKKPKHCKQCDKILGSWKKFYCDDKCFKQSKADKLREYRASKKGCGELKGPHTVGDCEWCQVLETEVASTFDTDTCCNACGVNKRVNGACPHPDCGRPLKKYRVPLDGTKVWRPFCTSCEDPPEGYQDVVLLNDYDNREKTVWLPIQRSRCRRVGKSGKMWVWVYKGHYEPRAIRGSLVVTVPLKWWLKYK